MRCFSTGSRDGNGAETGGSWAAETGVFSARLEEGTAEVVLEAGASSSLIGVLAY